MSPMYMCYFVIIYSWKMAWSLILTNVLYPRMLCVKFDWNWLIGSGQESFEILLMYFVFISPWRKAWLFICTHLNSPSPNDALCQVWFNRPCVKMWKFSYRQAEDRWSEILTLVFSSGKLRMCVFPKFISVQYFDISIFIR